MDVITEVLKPDIQYVEKSVPRIETETIERTVEVPQMLFEERLCEIPQVQICEQQRQELHPHVQQVVREIPKVKMEYVEKVVEVCSKISSEELERTSARYPWQRHEQVISSGNFLPRGGSSRSPSPMPVPPVPLPFGTSRGFASWSPQPQNSSRTRSPSPIPGGWQGGAMASPGARSHSGRGSGRGPLLVQGVSPERGGWSFNGGLSASMGQLPQQAPRNGYGGFNGGLSATMSNLQSVGAGSWGRNAYADGPGSTWRGRSTSPMPTPPPIPPPLFHSPFSGSYKAGAVF